jgi:ABC-type Fe3+ transport system permease subunit
LLWAVHERRLGLVLALATASALFHALEYLTIVSWSVRQRHTHLGNTMGILGMLVPRWGIALGLFVLILGVGGWLMDQYLLRAWLFLNVVVAFLHYAYDGLIWRRGN